MVDRTPRKISLAGQVIGEAKQIQDLATMANKPATSRKDAALYLTSAMQHNARIYDLLQQMADRTVLDMPEWFSKGDLFDIPRPQQ